jgi:hypothetical protein
VNGGCRAWSPALCFQSVSTGVSTRIGSNVLDHGTHRENMVAALRSGAHLVGRLTHPTWSAMRGSRARPRCTGGVPLPDGRTLPATGSLDATVVSAILLGSYARGVEEPA